MAAPREDAEGCACAFGVHGGVGAEAGFCSTAGGIVACGRCRAPICVSAVRTLELPAVKVRCELTGAFYAGRTTTDNDDARCVAETGLKFVKRCDRLFVWAVEGEEG